MKGVKLLMIYHELYLSYLLTKNMSNESVHFLIPSAVLFYGQTISESFLKIIFFKNSGKKIKLVIIIAWIVIQYTRVNANGH